MKYKIEDFVRYYRMAKRLQTDCNLGRLPRRNAMVDDYVLRNMTYGCNYVERIYAPTSQILLDFYYGNGPNHPYDNEIQLGLSSIDRINMTRLWKRKQCLIETRLYLMLCHRLTGSAINDKFRSNCYHKSLLFHVSDFEIIPEVVEWLREGRDIYTTNGYPAARFPKPNGEYERGGDYFLCEYAPRLISDLVDYLSGKSYTSHLDAFTFLCNWNQGNDLEVYSNQYRLFVSDLADFYPDFVSRDLDCAIGAKTEAILKKMGGRAERTLAKIATSLNANQYDIAEVVVDFEFYLKEKQRYDSES